MEDGIATILFKTESRPENEIGETKGYLDACTFSSRFWLPRKALWHKPIARERLISGELILWIGRDCAGGAAE